MNRVTRNISLLVRSIKGILGRKKTISKLEEWTNQQKQLPAYHSTPDKLLIIRLDEIGDYILWRNCLAFYKQSPLWRHYHITLLGNKAWQSIFEYADSGTVDEILWLDKKEYVTNEKYRFSLWQHIREQGFSTVICPTRIRNIWFDDYCMMASGSPDIIANHHVYPEDFLTRHLPFRIAGSTMITGYATNSFSILHSITGAAIRISGSPAHILTIPFFKKKRPTTSYVI